MINQESGPLTLASGRYEVLVTDAGAGRSTYDALALTRWSADPTREADGFFLYVRDLDRHVVWSAGLQPTAVRPARYMVRRAPDAFEIERDDDGIELITTLRLALEGDAELRRYTLTNRGTQPRHLELTTYAEVVLNTPAGDAGHPAFSKLFVQTEYHSGQQALLAKRRVRSPEDAQLCLVHSFVPDTTPDQPQYETDRARFIGRGRSLTSPQALDDGALLSGTTGNVLDPIVSLRHTVLLAPGESRQVTAVLGAAPGRDAAIAIAARYAGRASQAAPPSAPAAWLSERDAIVVATHQQADGVSDDVPCARPAASNDAGPDTPPLVDTNEPLLLFNGHGGFSADGREYVIRLDAGQAGPRRPPLPWINVIANEDFGFLTSESGAGYTWSENSRENRLTPWSNDPVCDPHGEALYIRDDQRGVFWSPTPGPTPGPGAYVTRHGFGYTRFLHRSLDLDQELVQFVPRRSSVKISWLRITNRGGSTRSLTICAYVEWVLGALAQTARPGVRTWRDRATGAIFAANDASGEFSHRVAFAALGPGLTDRGLWKGPAESGGRVHATADREAFLGRHGGTSNPAALRTEAALDGAHGAGLDPCAALMAPVEIAPGATADCVVLLGQAGSESEAIALIAAYRDVAAVRTALEHVTGFWKELLSGVQVETPSPAIDLMVNGWLSYQNLSCRMWGRSAFYQSGGAFGFRDQLQDSAALVYLDPRITRRQIVLHAGHQFVEGDVLHWWHPPTSKGIRTRFSDDLLWLPHVTAFYVRTTGDESVLAEPSRFVTARQLAPGEDEAFIIPEESGERGDVYEHCCRALDRSLMRGSHGLPLMGTGDWNDGMNRVGREGRGESVWLGFFLFDVLDDFIPLCERRADSQRAKRYRDYQRQLAVALNDGGWDGAWYRRAYYDDGSPLGSAESDECRIDAIAQAWAVISGAAPADRAAMALDHLERHLVSEPEGMIRLLAPPFDKTQRDPGYIKGYLPGVRENGGQYTHGALWAVRAMAEFGRQERAARLLGMMSPVSHALTPEAVAIYQTEPYVIAADVYGVAPHVGRGGWTWYTGSAGWMFRVALESVLGVELVGGVSLVLRPCIPVDWPGFTVRYRLPDGRTTYVVQVERSTSRQVASGATLDGTQLQTDGDAVRIPLLSDGLAHHVSVVLGADANPRYTPSKNAAPVKLKPR